MRCGIGASANIEMATIFSRGKLIPGKKAILEEPHFARGVPRILTVEEWGVSQNRCLFYLPLAALLDSEHFNAHVSLSHIGDGFHRPSEPVSFFF